MEQKNRIMINMTPFVAAAVARNEHAYKVAEQMYNQCPAECEEQARKSPFYEHEAITACRTEYVIKARKVLGVFAQFKDEGVERVLRSGWRLVFNSISENGEISNENFKKSVQKRDNDAQIDAFYVAICVIYSRSQKIPDNLSPAMVELTKYYSRNGAGRLNMSMVTEKNKADARIAFRGADNNGIGAIFSDYDKTPAYKDAEALFLALSFYGLHYEDYVSGMRMNTADRGIAAYCAEGTGMPIQAVGAICLLGKAIQADREYVLNNNMGSLQAALADKERERRESVRDAEISREHCRSVLKENEAMCAKYEQMRLENEKLRKALEGTRKESQEIGTLRTALYKAQNPGSIESSKAETRSIENLRIVVAGGHETWARQMRLALPTITVIPADVTADPNIIRSADELWIKADYIPHKQFYKVAGLAKSSGVDICYFSASNIARCAGEIMAMR